MGFRLGTGVQHLHFLCLQARDKLAAQGGHNFRKQTGQKPMCNKQINKLKHVSHKALLSEAVKADRLWWVNFPEVFNGKAALLEATPLECVFTDACDEAVGGVFGTGWFYFSWAKDLPQAQALHINEKEVLAMVVTAHR